MSQEHIEVVRRLFVGFDREDWAAALELFDQAVEWSSTEGIYHGPEGVLNSLVEWFEPWEEHHVEVDEVIDIGDQVLAVLHLSARARQSGMEIDQRFFQLYTVRAGRIIRMAEFLTRDEAVEAARVPG